MKISHRYKWSRSSTDRFVTLKQDDTTAFVSCSKIISSVVEFDGRDDIGFRYIFNITFVTKALGELPSGSSVVSFHHLSSHAGCAQIVRQHARPKCTLVQLIDLPLVGHGAI